MSLRSETGDSTALCKVLAFPPIENSIMISKKELENVKNGAQPLNRIPRQFLVILLGLPADGETMRTIISSSVNQGRSCRFFGIVFTHVGINS